MQRRAGAEGSEMSKRVSKRAARFNEVQATYLVAQAAYDTAIAAHNAECRSLGLFDRDDDAALDEIENVSQKHQTERLFDIKRAAETRLIDWSIEHACRMAPANAAELRELRKTAEIRPSVWSKMVDLAMRLSA